MGADRANIYRTTHSQSSAIVTGDRSVRFHHGTDSIDETQTDPSWWADVRDASRGTDATAWANAVDDVEASVSFTWTAEWTQALRRAFRD